MVYGTRAKLALTFFSVRVKPEQKTYFQLELAHLVGKVLDWSVVHFLQVVTVGDNINKANELKSKVVDPQFLAQIVLKDALKKICNSAIYCISKEDKGITVVTTIKKVLQGTKLQPLLVVILLRWIPCSMFHVLSSGLASKYEVKRSAYRIHQDMHKTCSFYNICFPIEQKMGNYETHLFRLN